MSTTIVVLTLVLLVVVFTGYYVLRLLAARRELSRREDRLPSYGSTEAGRSGPPLMSSRAEETTRGAAGVRVHEGLLGLKRVSEEPIFMRKRKDGEVSVQLEQRPASPLRYVLDPATRHVLEQVVARADSDYGSTWSVLAEEDTDGRLRLTRLG